MTGTATTSSTTRTVEALGVIVPARQDGRNARATVEALLASGQDLAVPLTVVVADNGGNDGFDGGLPDDDRVELVQVDAHGPGWARSAGVEAFAARVARAGIAPEAAWIVSLDADVVLDPGFLPAWAGTIATTTADVLVGPAHFGPLDGEPSPHPDVEAASSWMWSDTALYEHWAGVVNVGGCNHAVSLATCRANDLYLQPTTGEGPTRTVVAGDDWDFGLRARIRGRSVARVPGPGCTTSVRRIAADPAGFLAGRSYELPFAPIRDVQGSPPWPPDESWPAIAARGRARLVAHFLAKPLVAGLVDPASLDWFLGPDLAQELAALRARAPRLAGDWNTYRTELIDVLFDEGAFDLCGRIAQHLAGATR